MPESLLVNDMEFANVGHVIEALRYALAYHAADPSREIGVLLPSNSPWELAAFCPFVHGVYAVSPRLSDLPGSLEGVPRAWDDLGVDDLTETDLLSLGWSGTRLHLINVRRALDRVRSGEV